MKSPSKIFVGQLKNALLAATIFLSATQAQAHRIQKDYWPGTGLKWAALTESFVNQDDCNQDIDNFIGCLRALQQAVISQKTPFYLIAKDLQADFANNLKGQKWDFGPLAVIQLQKPAFQMPSIVESAQAKKNFQKKELDVFHKLFLSQSDPKTAIDFKALAAKVASDFVPASDEAVLTANSINAYLRAAFDPHTYIAPKAYIDAQQNIPDEQLVGIGITLQAHDGKLQVIEPVRGGASHKAGIKAGDIITQVDGVPVPITKPEDLDDISSHKIRGPEGSKVHLSIQRGDKTLEFDLVRSRVTASNVESQVVNDGDLNLGYVRVLSFMDASSCRKTAEAIKALESQGVKGIILDLRNNSGGRVDQGVCIAGIFLGARPIVDVKTIDGKEEQVMEAKVEQQTKLPALVLQNGISASASEIVSGALQDYQAAWILGERSFGKGSVQKLKPWGPNPKITYAQTYARFFQPSGRTNQATGITPDFEVAYKPGATEEDRYMQREADQYTNALPAIGKPWIETRGAQIDKIKTCVRTHGSAMRNYQKPKDDVFLPDYQLYIAQDVLSCSIQAHFQ